MTELRLVPSALVVWGCTWLCLWQRTIWWPLIACAVVAVGLAMWRPAQGFLAGCMGACATAITAMHTARVDAWQWGNTTVVEAITPVKQTATGWIFRAQISGYPAEIPVLSKTQPSVEPGDHVMVTGTVSHSGSIGLSDALLHAEGNITVVSPPTGWGAISTHITQHFQQLVVDHTDGHATGLIPAMVLGDTSLQSAHNVEFYAATGLAHLSAVSGGNVAIVTSWTAALAAVVGLGPRQRVIASMLALVCFVAVVGTEPSVLRAAVMGMVGLVAVLTYTRTPTIHALSIAIIGLLLWDCSLATHFGFALSVAATVGIITLYPAIYRSLAIVDVTPNIVVRALAIAIAADISTMPIVMLMSGKVSAVSVLANLLAAPVVPIVTLIGLLAVVASWLPVVPSILINIIEPCADWIGLIATILGGHTWTSIDQPFPESRGLSTLWAILGAMWLLTGFVVKPKITLATISCAMVATIWWQYTPTVPTTDLIVVTVADEEEIAGKTADVFVVTQRSRRTRETMTTDGTPIYYETVPDRISTGRIWHDRHHGSATSTSAPRSWRR